MHIGIGVHGWCLFRICTVCVHGVYTRIFYIIINYYERLFLLIMIRRLHTVVFTIRASRVVRFTRLNVWRGFNIFIVIKPTDDHPVRSRCTMYTVVTYTKTTIKHMFIIILWLRRQYSVIYRDRANKIDLYYWQQRADQLVRLFQIRFGEVVLVNSEKKFRLRCGQNNNKRKLN